MTLTKSLKVLGRISKSIQQELSNRDGFKTRVEKLKPFAQVKHTYTHRDQETWDLHSRLLGATASSTWGAKGA